MQTKVKTLLLPTIPFLPFTITQLITDALHSIIKHGSEFTSAERHMTLIDWIAAVHVVYVFTCEKIRWFGQLTSLNPAVVSSLLEKPSPEEGSMVSSSV